MCRTLNMLIFYTKSLDVLTLNLSKQYLSLARYSKSKEVMKVLNVAEKNDAAKNIAGYLSRGNSRRREGYSPYNKIYEFNSNLWNQNCDMLMTSVSGHLLNYAFTGAYRQWQGCHPLSLFDAPVTKQCIEEISVKIKQTLEREVKKCSALIIWTDCDREGENIGFEIISVCQAVKPNIRIYRAKFSEITQASVNRALENLCDPDEAVSNAVDVRSELDLRIGAAFTRFQTLRLQKVFPRTLADMLISYGSCQFPTLGFVVERFLAIERFKPEPYWKIKVMDIRDDISVEFRWARGRLFEKLPCEVLLETCLEQPNATVEKVTSKPKSKWRPLPLDTVELEKQGSRKLHLSAKETMKIAEKLYTQGLISYPRTETNIFPKELNLVPLVNQQTNSSAWGNFASQLLEEGLNPRQGKKSDQAHPPIHPIKFSNSLGGNEAKVYEFVVRHFLACLSKNAVGQETTVEIDIAGEKFLANGLQIIERNYLNVYIYERWSDKEILVYQEGQIFRPTSIDMLQEETSPPQLLTEADLISLMDKFGIGTDATHAEHIDTIKSRQYVGLVDGKHLMPGKLGIGLVMGYDNMGFEMSKPNLRADLERNLKLVCDRQKDPKDVLQTQINKYRDVFKIALERANLIDNALADYLGEQPTATEGIQINNPPEEIVILKCPKCNSNMTLKDKKQDTGKYIGCMGFPTCKNAIWFPKTVESVEVLDDVCSECAGNMRKLKFKLSRNAFPLLGTSYTTCIGGCDPSFNEVMNIKDENVKRGRQTTNDSGYSSTFDGSRSSAVSNPPPVRNSGDQQNRVRNRTNLSENNTSVGLVRPPNNNNQRNRPRDNNRNAKKQHDSKNNDTWIDTNHFNTSNNDFRQPRVQQSNAWDTDNNAVIMCRCHENAIQLTVRKEGPNQGRLFYKCAKPQGTGCDFFLWASDTAPQPQNSGNRNTNYMANTTNTYAGPSTSSTWGQSANSSVRPGASWGQNDTSESGSIKCNCNQLAKERTVQKDGPNKGRLFYSCPKPMNESCNFFQWADDTTQNHNASFGERGRGRGRENTQKKPRATGSKRKCGVCGIEGHTRKTCPQNAMD
ncbi:topoisomerase 3-alpha isoform X2 [Lasioglossum baleicum]|uniref:topoisomerase 3-alpha isoform X2 n=1 Tax=Lasioglossum baleicum TaxID=434251 RepID=UPI003FCE5683